MAAFVCEHEIPTDPAIPFDGSQCITCWRKARKEKRHLPARCANQGEPTGVTRPCQACGGRRVEVPLLACKVYGVCTVGKVVTLEDGTPVRPCSKLCPSYSTGDAK